MFSVFKIWVRMRENKHLGAGYDLAFNGAEALEDGDKNARGFNTSLVHEDLMIGSDEVSVTAVDARGKELPIITDGRFVI